MLGQASLSNLKDTQHAQVLDLLDYIVVHVCSMFVHMCYDVLFFNLNKNTVLILHKIYLTTSDNYNIEVQKEAWLIILNTYMHPIPQCVHTYFSVMC